MNFFVHRLDNAVDLEDYSLRWQSRVDHWENICTKEFQLIYFGKFSYDAIEDMPVHEREFFYGQLVQQKTSEREQYEKSVEEAKRKH